MARFHVGPQQQQAVVGLEGAQLRDPLGRLPVLHLAVPEAGGHQHRGIGPRLDPVVGRVREHVVVGRGRLAGVAPLVVFVGRQRDGLVEHGRDDVDERHVRDQRAVFVGREVRDRADQQAAGAAAHRADPARVGIALAHQVAGDVDEVVEGVPLEHQPALVVPAPAEFLAAAHVGDGVDEAAVDQRQHGGAEGRVLRGAVGAVAVLVERRAAVARRVAVVEQRDGHARAVARRRPDELGAVARRVEVAEHRLALQQRARAGAHVVVVGGRRRRHRGVDVAQQVGVGFLVGGEGHRVGRLVGVDQEVAAAVPGAHAQLAQPAGALADREEAREHLEARDEGLVGMGDHVAPLSIGRRPRRPAPRRCGSWSPASWCGSRSGRRGARAGTRGHARAARRPGSAARGRRRRPSGTRPRPCSARRCRGGAPTWSARRRGRTSRPLPRRRPGRRRPACRARACGCGSRAASADPSRRRGSCGCRRPRRGPARR